MERKKTNSVWIFWCYKLSKSDAIEFYYCQERFQSHWWTTRRAGWHVSSLLWKCWGSSWLTHTHTRMHAHTHKNIHTASGCCKQTIVQDSAWCRFPHTALSQFQLACAITQNSALQVGHEYAIRNSCYRPWWNYQVNFLIYIFRISPLCHVNAKLKMSQAGRNVMARYSFYILNTFTGFLDRSLALSLGNLTHRYLKYKDGFPWFEHFWKHLHNSTK